MNATEQASEYMGLSGKDLEGYDRIRSGSAGFIERPRGLIAVSGKEAIQFLDGLITNDMKTLGDGQQMLAAFPNAQGRLLAVVRVLRQGDRFLFETEDATREKLYTNLFRFTYAGDFFVEDLSESYRYFEFFGTKPDADSWRWQEASFFGYIGRGSEAYFIPSDEWAEGFREKALSMDDLEISGELYETLRIESGIPKYGVDMDEHTIVPELGLDGMISYTKGCYIGQEIIARIHFRGHVAKQLTGLFVAEGTEFLPGAELTTPDGKNAGRITSVAYSPELEKNIALAFVRYDYLAEGTELRAGESTAAVTKLPFIE